MTLNSEMLAAAIFVGFGVVAMAAGLGYGFGTPAAMGAGAMPLIVGGALVGLGAVQGLRALRQQSGGKRLATAFARSEIRPLLFVLAAVVAFGLLVEPLGLVPALVALILLGWFADRGGRSLEMLLVLVVVTALVVAIFDLALGIPFRLVAWGG